MVYQFGMIWTIPNSLTVLRLLAAPGVAIMFLYFHRPWADWLALTLFVGAAITDWFDGYLARLWKQESKFGAMLDPIADKAMVVIAIMVITGYNGMNPWLILPAALSGGGVAGGVFDRSLIGLKLARDGHAPVGSIAWAAAQNVNAVPAPARGKHDCASYANLVGIWLMWVAALLTMVTGWEYFVKSLPFLREDK